MPTTITRAKAHKLTLLHDELLAAFPALRETLRVEGPRPNDPPNTIRLTVPDGTDEAAIVALIQAHNPAAQSVAEQQDAKRTASNTDLSDAAEATLTRLDAIITNGSSFTAVQVRDAVVDMARLQRRLLRYLLDRMSG